MLLQYLANVLPERALVKLSCSGCFMLKKVSKGLLLSTDGNELLWHPPVSGLFRLQSAPHKVLPSSLCRSNSDQLAFLCRKAAPAVVSAPQADTAYKHALSVI